MVDLIAVKLSPVGPKNLAIINLFVVDLSALDISTMNFHTSVLSTIGFVAHLLERSLKDFSAIVLS